MGPAVAAALRTIGPALGRHAPAVAKFANNLGMVSEAAKGVTEILGELKSMAMGLANTLGGRWYEMNDIAFKTARTMAMSREQAIRYNQQLIDSTRELAAQYGVTAKELADFQQSYAEAVGRNIILTREQLSHMSALSKITDQATASKLVDEFDKVGVGIARATAYTGRLQERAKALGISPAKATKTMADNIKLAASYSFRNGVNDIEKMALKATSMRMDMNAIMNATEKFADIEGAISTSANIQMLGGSFAREFSNPMGAMFEAQADPAAFQDRILRAIEGKGSYDKKTGAVIFDPVTMRMMREVAKQLGMTAEQLNTSAMASVQNKKVDEEFEKNINKLGFSEKDKEAIRNLSRTNVDEKTGKHFITYLEDGEEKTAFVEDLTQQQLELAKDSQMTEEGLWGDVQDIKTILERVHGRARETKSMKEGVEGAKSWWDAQIVNIQDRWMKPISGIWNGITNWLGKQYYAEGGVVEPVHAEFGTMVPGDSYSGDKVHAMVNSGEMILNPMQQKSMFNLISSLALNGGMAFGMNKLGGKMGYGGLGSTMLLGNMIGGGDAGLKEYVEAHFIQKFIKNMLPFKESIKDVSTVTSDATKSTNLFKQNWKELTGTLSKDWSSFTRRLSVTSKRYFTTGKWGTVTRGVGNIATSIGTKATQFGSYIGKYTKIIGETIGKYTVKPIASFSKKAGDWFVNTKPILKARQKIDSARVQANLGYKQIVKPKVNEYSKLVRNLFNDGSKAQASKAASRAISNTAIKEVAKEASTVSKAGLAAKGGKLLSNIGKVGKVAGKFVKPLAAVGAIAGIASDVSTASSQYDAKIDEIEKSGMSEQDKARAKDRATKQKNTAIGGSVGSNTGMAVGGFAGAAKGGALGLAVGGPIGAIAGTLIGGAIGAFGGEKLGGLLGKGVGSMFGGSEEKKFKQEQKELFEGKEGIKSNDDAVKVLTSIDNKMSVITGKDFGVKSKLLASPSLPKVSVKTIGTVAGTAIGSILGPLGMVAGGLVGSKISDGVKSLPISGNFMKVKPTKDSDTEVGRPSSVGKTDINLNVSGTIKLEGGGKSVDFDLAKLIDTPEFKRQLADIVTRRINESSNSGKRNMESERNNMASQYNKSGK